MSNEGTVGCLCRPFIYMNGGFCGQPIEVTIDVELVQSYDYQGNYTSSSMYPQVNKLSSSAKQVSTLKIKGLTLNEVERMKTSAEHKEGVIQLSIITVVDGKKMTMVVEVDKWNYQCPVTTSVLETEKYHFPYAYNQTIYRDSHGKTVSDIELKGGQLKFSDTKPPAKKITTNVFQTNALIDSFGMVGSEEWKSIQPVEAIQPIKASFIEPEKPTATVAVTLELNIDGKRLLDLHDEEV